MKNQPRLAGKRQWQDVRFLKLLNGQYGMYYRKMEGGQGYVFQSRFKSTIIEDDSYLIKSIEYLLQNPVRAGIVHRAENYAWSSIQYYFSIRHSKIFDAEYVNQLFGTKESLCSALESLAPNEISVKITKHGELLGSETFLKLALRKFNRRKRPPSKVEECIGKKTNILNLWKECCGNLKKYGE